MNTPLEVVSLRAQALALLRERICLGQLSPGDRVLEIQASEELGISRTPLREALLQLEQEGLVVRSPPRGFRVAPFSEQEVRDVYPMLGALEALAVRSLPGLEDSRVERLRQINAGLRPSAADPSRSVVQDAAWHTTLLETTPNRRALALIETLRRQVQRYEYAYMQVGDSASRSPRQHDRILDSLLAGDPESAARTIEAQWVDGVEPVVRWIRSRIAAPDGPTPPPRKDDR